MLRWHGLVCGDDRSYLLLSFSLGWAYSSLRKQMLKDLGRMPLQTDTYSKLLSQQNLKRTLYTLHSLPRIVCMLIPMVGGGDALKPRPAMDRHVVT